MSEPGSPTLDQLQIFLAVVEEGSFAAAGRRLNRAVSVISYGVSNLEAQLGLTLFTREGTKKPVLTKEGEAILADARVVAAGLAGLRARAKGLLEGLEAEVSLAVDVMLPAERLAQVLRGFASEFPTVPLRLHVEALGAVAALVLDGKAGLGIAGPVAAGIEGLDRVEAGSVLLVPVAAPDHPLARATKLKPGAGRDHIQLDAGARLCGPVPAHVAAGGPRRETRAAARGDRVGQHAAADDRGGSGCGHAGQAGHARRYRRAFPLFRNPSRRCGPGPGDIVAAGAVRDAGFGAGSLTARHKTCA